MLRHLPSLYFGYAYLHTIATASSWMLNMVRDKKDWQGLVVDIDQPDLQVPARLRSIIDPVQSYPPSSPPVSHPDRCGGGSSSILPLEVTRCLPSFYFEHAYLHALATTSSWMLNAARDKNNWQGSVIDVDRPELRLSTCLLSIVDLLTLAASLTRNHRMTDNVIVNQHMLEALPWECIFKITSNPCENEHMASVTRCYDFFGGQCLDGGNIRLLLWMSSKLVLT